MENADFSLGLEIRGQIISFEHLTTEKGLLKCPPCSFSRNVQLMCFISTVPICFVVSWECQKPIYQSTWPKTKTSCFLAALTFSTVQQHVLNAYYLGTYYAK